MDLSLLFTVSTLFLIPPFIIFFFYKHNINYNKNLPPGKTGWPVIGESHELVSTGKSGHPDMFFKKRMNKYSPEIFKSSFAGEKLAVFCGPSGNKFLFSNENKLFISWLPSAVERVTGVSATTRKHLHKIMPEFLKPEALKKYIPIIDSCTMNHMNIEWMSTTEVKVFPSSKNLTFSLTCKLFMSIEDHSFITEFADNFAKLTAGLFSVPINLPGTTFYRALKAANSIRDELLPVIKERRKVFGEKTDQFDLISKFLTCIDEDGKLISDTEIAGSILGILLASHDTTSTVITFVVYYLADHPQIYAKVLHEQLEILKSKEGDELLNWDDIQRMKYSRNVIHEVLRLHPPAPGFFRQVVNDVTFANLSIPKGWKTFWSVHTTHRDPKYFPDPEKFDPTRFEGKGLTPYTFVPFGGGPSMCPGGEFARIVVLVFMHRLVTKFKFNKIIPDEKIVYGPSPVLVNGLPVTLSRASSSLI